MMNYEDIMKACKEEGTLPGFAISKVPFHLFEEFMCDVKDKYNGVYWAKLSELMWKAKAFEVMAGLQLPQQDTVVEDDDPKVPVTFGRG